MTEMAVIAGLTRNPDGVNSSAVWMPDQVGMTGDGLDPQSTCLKMRVVYFVYLLASQRNGTLYVGVTNDLVRRVHEHKSDLVDGFTKQYGVHMLVWFESTQSVEAAIEKEKQIKNWKREWKVSLIEKENPTWADLYDNIL